MAKRTQTVSVDIRYGTTAQEIKDALAGVPGNAEVDVYTSEGDRPWESPTSEIKFSWTEQV